MHTREASFTRREFIRLGAGTAAFALAASRQAQGAMDGDSITVRFGVFTDSHYADKDAAGTRHYRDSAPKLKYALKNFSAAGLDFLIELGDFIDGQPTPEDEMAKARDFDKLFASASIPRYHVLGNHDLALLDKAAFLSCISSNKSYYSFPCGPFLGLVLDANFNRDETPYAAGRFDWTEAYIPAAQREWLKAALAAADRPALIFVHQCLDDDGPHGVRNAPLVRKILEKSRKVSAVLQGHKHSGGFNRIAGIPYFTFRAMVEGPYPANNAFAIAEAVPGATMKISGFGAQPSSEESLPTY